GGAGEPLADLAQLVEAADVVDGDLPVELHVDAMERRGTVVPLGELRLLLARGSEQLGQDPAQPRPEPTRPRPAEEAAGPERHDDRVGRAVAIGERERLDA